MVVVKRKKEKRKKDDSGSDEESTVKRLKNADGYTYFELKDDLTRATVKKFKGLPFVDLRRLYRKDGSIEPTQKGIALKPAEWEKLKSLFSDIDEQLANI